METKQWMSAQIGGGWCLSAVVTVTVAHLHWHRLLQVWHVGSCSVPVIMQANSDHVENQCFIAENLPYQIVVVCSLLYLLFAVSAIVSMEIHRKHYIQSNLCN